MSFLSEIVKLDWNDIGLFINSKTNGNVEKVISKNKLDIYDFATLLSPAAASYLPQLRAKAQQKTRQRFGHTMRLFMPLYLSNVCSNHCTYCGFSIHNKVKRKTLRLNEVKAEAIAIANKGIDSILLVTGEAPKTVGINYFLDVIKVIQPFVKQINLECQPLPTSDYQRLKDAGLNGISLYQESYHQTTYECTHLSGSKQSFVHRLESAERVLSSGIDKLNIGVLLGLTDWRTDSLVCAMHAQYLKQKYWSACIGLSVPRLRPSEADLKTTLELSDAQFLQLIYAWRILDEDMPISLSTREEPPFRDEHLVAGFTHMSAESSTQPGGYSQNSSDHLMQFETGDQRNVQEIINQINRNGLDAVHEDWLW